MKTPNEFLEVCRNLHQDLHLHTQSLDEIVQFSTSLMSDAERLVVVAYLKEILSDRYSDEDIKRIWFETPADVYFTEPRQLRGLLEKMHDHLALAVGGTRT
jgi:hypothetical protein